MSESKTNKTALPIQGRNPTSLFSVFQLRATFLTVTLVLAYFGLIDKAENALQNTLASVAPIRLTSFGAVGFFFLAFSLLNGYLAACVSC